MAASFVRWLESYDFSTQIIILACVFDPLGGVFGYLIAPAFDLDWILGVALGVLVASWVTGAWVLRHVVTNDGDAATS